MDAVLWIHEEIIHREFLVFMRKQLLFANVKKLELKYGMFILTVA